MYKGNIMLETITYIDLLRIDKVNGWRRYLGEKNFQRAKLVLVDGMKHCDVAKIEGVTGETIGKAVRKARWGFIKLKEMDNKNKYMAKYWQRINDVS